MADTDATRPQHHRIIILHDDETLACPYCGHVLKMAALVNDRTGVPNDGTPDEGDFTCCGGCQRMLVYTKRPGGASGSARLAVRRPEPGELAAGLADPIFGPWLKGER